MAHLRHQGPIFSFRCPVDRHGDDSTGEHRVWLKEAFPKNRKVAVLVLAALLMGSTISCSEKPPRSQGQGPTSSVELSRVNTGLPVIAITTNDPQAVIGKDAYVGASISITNPVHPMHSYVGTGAVRGRGNTTWRKPKKPYAIRLDHAHSLFGLPIARHWVLLANYQDPTLLMNTVAFELGQRLGMPFTAHVVHVEVVLNGVYQGSYALTEKIEVAPGRVELEEGFLVEMDTNFDKVPKFTSSRFKLPIMVKYSRPDAWDTISIQRVFDELERALLDPDARPPLHDILDVKGAVEYVFLHDFLMNLESVHPKSVYLYQREGEKLKMGPIWDFDWGYGYAGQGRDYFTQTPGSVPAMNAPGKAFFDRLRSDSLFTVLYGEYWDEHRETYVGMSAFIDSMAQVLASSQALNSEVWQWPDDLGHASEVERMKRWWELRIKQFDAGKAAPH
jgi:hypothetical protein